VRWWMCRWTVAMVELLVVRVVVATGWVG